MDTQQFSSIKSRNIFADVFLSVSKRPKKQDESPLYFYRYIGIKNNIASYKHSVELMLMRMDSMKIKKIVFQNSIPILKLPEKLKKLDSILNSIDSVDVSNAIRTVQDFLFQQNYPDILRTSIDVILNIYLEDPKNRNTTKLKNFILKILTWADRHINDTDFSSTDIPSKAIFIGDIKSHESYFLTLLHLVGLDVIYINTTHDCSIEFFKRISNLEEFSLKDDIELLEIAETRLKQDKKSQQRIDFEYHDKKKPNSSAAVQPSIPTRKSFDKATDIKVMNSLKPSNKPFDDIFTPLASRSQFVFSDTVIVSNYFLRILGFDEDLKKYSNKIFHLIKKAESKKYRFLLFENHIPVKSNSKLSDEFSVFFESISKIDNSCTQNFIDQVNEKNIFDVKFSKRLKNSILIGLYNSISLYMSIEKDLSPQKFKNFALKMLFWSQDILDSLFDSRIYKTEKQTLENPKLLYYGNIKLHETYFLIFLSSLGTDVLYINPGGKDITFPSDEVLNSISTLIDYENHFDLALPKEEFLISEETVAFKASQEIEGLLHGEETGIYKPWQFENASFKPVLLKTTYDELRLLWNEEARIRSGFEIKSERVKIPTIFCKVSGTEEDLSEYVCDFDLFTKSHDTIFYESVPFYKKNYSSGNWYLLSSVLGKDGLVDSKRLKSHTLYKYSHLKTSLQDNICKKLNLIFSSEILNVQMTTEMKLQIILVVLNLEKDILNLLQNHDYPFFIPKIVVYDNTSTMFEIEDSILLVFLHLMAFDILILTPSGYNNIESHIGGSFIQTHKLEKLRFDLDMENARKQNTKGFFSGLFG